MDDQHELAQPAQAPAIQAKEVARQVAHVAQQQERIDVEGILAVAEPLAKSYFDAQAAKHEREIAYDTKVLEYDARRHKLLVVSFSFLTAGILVFAGYLITHGRDTVAVDLIRTIVSLAGVGFGAYGLAVARRRREEGEE